MFLHLSRAKTFGDALKTTKGKMMSQKAYAMINALPKFCMMEEAVLSFFPLHGLVALLDFLVNVCTMMVCTFLLVL